MFLALITLTIITIVNPLMRPTAEKEIKEIDPSVFRFTKYNEKTLLK